LKILFKEQCNEENDRHGKMIVVMVEVMLPGSAVAVAGVVNQSVMNLINDQMSL
jgi:hypothetical protein